VVSLALRQRRILHTKNDDDIDERDQELQLEERETKKRKE